MRRFGRTFGVRLGMIAGLALALRVLYLLVSAPAPARTVDDTFWYSFVSDQIVRGHGFAIGFGSLFHVVPTAQHPPLYPLVLAGLRDLGIASPDRLIWLGAITGTLTVVGVGLLGRALAEPVVGLAAAGLAAVYPLLIVVDGALLSETLYGPAIVLVLAAALALARRQSAGWAALLGLAIGVAALVRSDALGLVVVLALPLAWRGAGGTKRALRVAITVACALAVLAPWVLRNEHVFRVLTLSTDDGTTLAWSNCASTYHGHDVGYKNPACAPSGLTGNEAQQAAALRRRGLRYAVDHAGRLPVVVAARLGRTWGLFQPFRGSSDPGRNVRASDLGVLVYYPLAALAVVGAWALRCRRAELWVLLAPFVLVTLISGVTYGSLRPRYMAELPLVLLAALGSCALVERWNARRPAQPATPATPG